MRIIVRKHLDAFATEHPAALVSLASWQMRTRAARWQTTGEVQQAFPKAKVLNAERVRFEIAGGQFRLIVAFDFPRQIAFIKFIGTHAAYDRIDALTVTRY
ncbi:MAG: type II toxin-antitoxin system HigB family toxin [Beijerinckiaceae bacterium]